MFDRCRENSSDGSVLHSPPDKKGSLSRSARGSLSCPGSTLGFQPPSWLSGTPLSSCGARPLHGSMRAHALRLGNAAIFPAQPRHLLLVAAPPHPRQHPPAGFPTGNMRARVSGRTTSTRVRMYDIPKRPQQTAVALPRQGLQPSPV